MKSKVIFLFAFLISCSFLAHAQIITTVAGGDTALGDGGPAVDCELYNPAAVAFDAAGNYYITDRGNNRIRKVDITTGIITTIAGTGTAGFNGDNLAATATEIYSPYGIAIDSAGNIFFCDDGNHRIRKISASGIITTVAGNGTPGYNGDDIPATSAEINDPGGPALDVNGNIYIADYYNNRIRKVNAAGVISTIAGTGTAGYNGDNIAATTAELYNPEGIVVDTIGNIYISDCLNNRIRKINTSGIITTIAGTGTLGISGDNGPATTAELNRPVGITIDENNNIYFADTYNHRVRKIYNSGIITTIAGNDTLGFAGDGGPAIHAELGDPTGVTLDTYGNIYIADLENDRIRFVTSTVSVKNQNLVDDNINIYPNPSNGIFTADIMSTANETATIVVTNILGQRIKEITTLTNQLLAITIDVPSGIYFLTAVTSSGTATKKILINKCC